MRSDTVVDILLEAEEDADALSFFDSHVRERGLFDRGIQDILQDARELFLRLEADGTIATLFKYGGRGQLVNYDDSAVAQAVMRRAIERRGAPGVKRAYRALRRLNYYNF